MALNTQPLLSGAALYLLVIAVLYGRWEVLPKGYEKTDIMQTIYKQAKREGEGEAKKFRTDHTLLAKVQSEHHTKTSSI